MMSTGLLLLSLALVGKVSCQTPFCQHFDTPCNADGAGNTVFLDRHQAYCQTTTQWMTAWRLIRCPGLKTYRISVTCCQKTAPAGLTVAQMANVVPATNPAQAPAAAGGITPAQAAAGVGAAGQIVGTVGTALGANGLPIASQAVGAVAAGLNAGAQGSAAGVLNAVGGALGGVGSGIPGGVLNAVGGGVGSLEAAAANGGITPQQGVGAAGQIVGGIGTTLGAAGLPIASQAVGAVAAGLNAGAQGSAAGVLNAVGGALGGVGGGLPTNILNTIGGALGAFKLDQAQGQDQDQDQDQDRDGWRKVDQAQGHDQEDEDEDQEGIASGVVNQVGAGLGGVGNGVPANILGKIGGALSWFRLDQAQDQAAPTCGVYQTACNDGGLFGNAVFLDRHNVACPSTSQYLVGWNMVRCGPLKGKIFIKYTCCQ